MTRTFDAPLLINVCNPLEAHRGKETKNKGNLKVAPATEDGQELKKERQKSVKNC